MKIGISRLLCLLLVIAPLTITGCATKKRYHGFEATDLSGLFYGMERLDAEIITGKHKREFQCSSGTIVTYVYGRGYTGCVGEWRCKPESESTLQTIEIINDIILLGGATAIMSMCLKTCQEGHLELFFDDNDLLIGVRELPSDRDDYCWDMGGWNDERNGYPCALIFNKRRPSTISKSLILLIDQEDIPDKICDQFTR